MFWWDEICCSICRLTTGDELMLLGSFRNSRRLEAVIAFLVGLWLVGYFVIRTGWWIHILLVLAIILLAGRFIRGRPAN